MDAENGEAPAWSSAVTLARIAGGVQAEAPAKLNLFLELLGRRADGYHDVETFMVAVDLRDRLVARDAEPGALAMSCNDPRIPTDSRNLVLRAAERLRRESGTGLGASFELTKAIPAEAGLGGGSADAAATLLALDRLWNLEAPRDRLLAIAEGLGADVPFFLTGGQAAIGRGRGDVLTPMTPRRTPQPFWLVLVRPAFGLSTAEVYARASVPAEPRSVDAVAQAWSGDDPAALAACLFNRLQQAALAIRPELSGLVEALGRQIGTTLHGACMTGSGSCFFAIARCQQAAADAADALATHRECDWAKVVGAPGRADP